VSPGELDLLGKVFDAEVQGALTGGCSLYQTRKLALALKLVGDGLLRECVEVFGGRFPVTIKGFELTELGRLTYCMTCTEGDET
jgi:hypothetical protein